MKCEKCGNEFEGNFCPECGEAAVKTKNVCAECGMEFEGNFCSNCGRSAKEKEVLCPFCGTEVKGSFCLKCGRMIGKQTEESVAEPSQEVINHVNAVSIPGVNVKYKWATFLLCLFFGVFGVHKFYEGKNKMGLIYLFTAGLCGIGWVIDLLLILFKPDVYTV